MDIYINQTKKISLAAQTAVYIKDIAEVVANGEIGPKVKNIKLLSIDTRQNKAHFLIKNIDVIHAIRKIYPDYTVNSIGEMDTMVEYVRVPHKDSNWLQWIKVVAVVLILLTGSATAIMSFHTDADMPRIFEKYYEIFTGEKSEKPLIIVIPYAIGILTGILVFFNHFTGKKITDDPTPIEVEITQYENNVTDTVLDVLDTRRMQGKKEKSNGTT